MWNFQITEKNFIPDYAVAGLVDSIASYWGRGPKKTREIMGWWDQTAKNRSIVVPFAEGGSFPEDFLFRVFVRPEYKTVVR